MADPQHVRKSGKTTAQETTREVAKTFEEPVGAVNDIEGDPKRDRTKRPYLQRLRVEWTPDQQIVLSRIHGRVEKIIEDLYSDALEILLELYLVVRTPSEDPDADDPWLKNEMGSYVEDWSKLTHRQRERFLFLITTRLVTWEQLAAKLNFEALFAKAEWERSFATGYESLPGTRPTIEDRTSRARIESLEDYHFAIMRTYLSRRADAMVRTMQMLALRIKDVHTA